MGDYSRARKIYCSSPLACIHTLEPSATGLRRTFGPASIKRLSAMFPKSSWEYNVGVPEFEILLLFTETHFHEFGAQPL
jgi:hypothetical protein